MKFVLLTIITFLNFTLVAHAEEDQSKRFFEVIQPLLKSKCLSCHGSVKQEGSLRLDSLANAMKGGDSGPAVVPKNTKESLLIQAIHHHEDVSEMPPKEKLADDKIEAFEKWIQSGAIWPRTVLVLFDDEKQFVNALKKGKASIRIEEDDSASGKISVAVTPRERFSEQIADWRFSIRENPKDNEYRFLHFAWKKHGGGGAMIEVANTGKWPDAKSTKGRYVSGKNNTDLAARTISDKSPDDWTEVTVDLWKDMGNITLTGLSLMASDGKETLFDSILLSPDKASFKTYRPGRGELAFKSYEPTRHIGNAWKDKENPITKIFHGERLDLWSLKPPQRPELPVVKSTKLIRTPVDQFVLKRLETNQLTLSPEADRRTLIRRLSFDLIGLPPTPKQVQDFTKDKSPKAYSNLVEQLLTSKRYGEHWTRHWLDVVRYADSNGYERDEFRSNMFRYRDYVIRSLNADKPYDQFLQEQLAGDEMVSGQPRTQNEADMLIATGYLRLGGFDSTAPIFQEEKKFRNELMADLANTTSSAMLGLTLSCCNCHDHKYDPLSQADHFRFRAFFASVENRDKTIIDTINVQEEINLHNKPIDENIAKWEKESAAILTTTKEQIVNARRTKFPAEIITLLNKDTKKRTEQEIKKLKPWLEKLKVTDEVALEKMAKPEKNKRDLLVKQIETERAKLRDNHLGVTMTDATASAPDTHIFYQGDHTQSRELVQPGFLSYIDPNPAKISTPPSGKTTGRRLALAHWITAPDNPFTARVIVNRIWHHYFGHGIVTTPNDFGYSGSRPTHPELLDWLATELIENGWSLKHIHRVIVNSATYQQSSLKRTSASKIDPDNKYFWRQNVRRITAETLRDTMLTVSGRMLAIESGPAKWPPVPDDILQAEPAILEAIKGNDGGRQQGWYPDPVESTYVRSLFLIQKRSVPIPFLQPFDIPETTISCSRRDVTTVAPQALNLLNSPFTIEMSNSLAKRVTQSAGTDNDKCIEKAIWLTLSRAPYPYERNACLKLIEHHTKTHLQKPKPKATADTAHFAALVDMCRALLNVNEFIYID